MNRGFLVCFTFLAFLSAVRGQQPGDSVVIVSGKANIQIGEKVVDTAYQGAIFVVRRVQNEWLSVSHGTPGWVNKEDVMLLGPAVEYFTSLIQQNPAQAGLHFVRGNIHSARGEYAKAVEDYSQAIKLDSTDSAAHNGRGYAYHRLGELDKAIADFNQALQLNGRDVWAYNNRGIIWFEKGEYDKAIADYDQALRIEPKHAWSHQNRGNARAARGELVKAIEDYNEAVQLDPRDYDGYVNRGRVHQVLGDYASALADFDRAVSSDSARPAAYVVRALLLAACPISNLRDGSKAVADGKRACEMTVWKDAAALNAFAAASAEAGDFDAAVRWQARALELAAKEDRDDYRTRLELYREGKAYRLQKNERR